MLTVAEIYCGGGGLSAGFKLAKADWPNNAGEKFEIVYGVDRDKNAIKTFRAFHFPHFDEPRLEIVAPCKDVRDVTAKSILKAIAPHNGVDILIGGPSCQGVSAAGLRNPDDHRNEMLLKFIDLVRKLRPKWFLIENVPGLTHENNRELLAEIFKELESIKGYTVSGDVLLAADYGVPQFRYRLFIVGTNTGAPIRFPKPKHVSSSVASSRRLPLGEPTYITVEQAIYDLAKFPPIMYDEDEAPDESAQPKQIPRNHHCIDIGEMNKKRISSVQPGRDWRSMPVGLLPERYFATRSSDQKGSYGRLAWNWPAYTLTNATCNVTAGPFTHPDEDRMLSVREAARLQSFTDDHVFYGSLESQYRQVGNAVPPRLASAVAEAILYCHYRRESAMNWGKAGRLSYELIRSAVDGKISFPTMTPRQVNPESDRRLRKRAGNSNSRKRQEPSISAWNARPRPSTDPHPKSTRKLRILAEQPGNYRAAKRAKAIVSFLDGKSKKDIVQQANVSEASVKKWVDGYFSSGLDGWRAYHTSLDGHPQISAKLARRIKRATTRVRRTLLAPSQNGAKSGSRPKRLHMNHYLIELIKRFSKNSVDELLAKVEKKLGTSVGTVYVADLLAICDVVLGSAEDHGTVSRAPHAARQTEMYPASTSP